MPSCSRESPDRGTEHLVAERPLPAARAASGVCPAANVPQQNQAAGAGWCFRAAALLWGRRRGRSHPALPRAPQGLGPAPWQQQGIPCHPMAEVFSVGPQLYGCPDSGTDASPGAWEVASPEAFSSSVTPVRFKLNTLHHRRNLPGSVSFSVIPEQGAGPPAATKQLTGSHPRMGCGEVGELAAAKMRSEETVLCRSREREQATPGGD